MPQQSVIRHKKLCLGTKLTVSNAIQDVSHYGRATEITSHAQEKATQYDWIM